MDETALLRRLRPDVDEPTPQALARARTRLLDRAHQSANERADGLRLRPSPRMSPGRRRTAYRLVGLGGTAATVAAVLVAVPLTGKEVPAQAAVLLTQASEEVEDEPVAGAYERITTRSAALSYVTDDAGGVTGAYVYRTVDDTYVPLDPGQEWVSLSAGLPPGASYGPPVVAARARRDYASSSQVEEPTVTRAVGGAFGAGELGVEGGQGLSYAMTADLDSLPRDPEALLEDLAARSDGADSSRAVRVMTQVATLLGSGLVDAQLTSAMYRALALLPEVVITEQQTDLDGRSGTAFGVVDDDGFATIEVIVAVEEGQVLGVRSRQLDEEGPVPAGTVVWSTAVVSTPVSSLLETASPASISQR